MNLFEKLTQDQLKMILMDVQEKGESLLIEDPIEMINELKRQILFSINQNNLGFDRYEKIV